MADQFSGSFNNDLDSPNSEENSNIQNSQSRSRLNPRSYEFPYSSYFPQNIPTGSNFGPNFPQNIPTGSNVIPNPQFQHPMIPAEYYNPMGGPHMMTHHSHAFHHPQPWMSESHNYGFRGSGSDREPTTPISRFGSQIPPHSTQPEIENINLNDDDSGAKQKNVHRNRGKVIWSTEEEKCLARAWGTTTNDPKVGNAQKSKHFWQSTATYYNDNRPVGTPMREWSSIKSHYYRVMPDVDKFSGRYNNLLNNRASGQSDADVLAAAHDMWKTSNKNKAFKYEHVWKIVMECEKWAPQSLGHHSNKKSRTSETGAHSSSTNPDTDEAFEVRARPIGQQKAKRKQKDKVTDDRDFSLKWEQMQEYQKEKLAMKEVELRNKEAEIKQKEGELQQKALELEQRDYEIVTKDTSRMTETQLHWHMKVVEAIVKRRGWQ